MTTNTFTKEVSKRLREMGVEVEKGKKLEEHAKAEHFPAYTLHDILRLLKPIADKIHGYNKEGWADFWGTGLTKSFLEKDYAGAEQYLMSIITKDHGK